MTEADIYIKTVDLFGRIVAQLHIIKSTNNLLLDKLISEMNITLDSIRLDNGDSKYKFDNLSEEKQIELDKQVAEFKDKNPEDAFLPSDKSLEDYLAEIKDKVKNINENLRG